MTRNPSAPAATGAATVPPPTGTTPGGRPIALRAAGHYLFVVPAILLVGVIVYGSILYTVWVSTRDWDGIAPSPPSVGLDNFGRLLQDAVFWKASGHVALFAAVTISVQMALGLAVALLLTTGVRLKAAYKTVMFIPVVLAPAATAALFRQLMAPEGQFNDILGFVGLDALARSWLADPKTALYAIAVINIWQWTGFSFILYQAALTQLDPSVIEAAGIDGAGPWALVRRIIIPQLRGTHIVLVLTGIIGALKTFDIVYLTTGGGPGDSTEFLTTYLYDQTVTQFHVGYGAALSVLMLLIALLLTVGQVRAFRTGEAR